MVQPGPAACNYHVAVFAAESDRVRLRLYAPDNGAAFHGRLRPDLLPRHAIRFGDGADEQRVLHLDFGDSSSPVTWWYDEYNFNLGQPSTPATLLGAGPGANEIANSGFTSGLSPWRLGVTSDGSGQATATIDATGGVSGGPAAHISVTSPATVDWHMEFQQGNLQLTAGQEYEVQFQARAGAPLTFEMFTQGGTSPYAAYGLNSTVTINQNWAQYAVYFVASATASDGILEFRVGNQAGDIWLDNIQLFAAPTRIYRRDFTNGVVFSTAPRARRRFPSKRV